MKISNYLIAVMFLVLSGCQSTNGPDELKPDATIVFGESIARVKIGDDSSTVIRKLGRPTEIGPGDFKGYVFYYTDGMFAQTFVSISKDPYLGLGVIAMSIDSPYVGKSKDGIGINSGRDLVLSRLGPPDKTEGETPIYDSYYYNENSFGITYVNNHILRIGMSMPRHK